MNDHLTAVNGTRERVETAGTSERYAVRVIRLIDALKETAVHRFVLSTYPLVFG